MSVNESWASSPGVRRGMQANRGRDTKPEMAVRRAVHARDSGTESITARFPT